MRIYKIDYDKTQLKVHELIKFGPKDAAPLTCELITLPVKRMMPEAGVTVQSGLQIAYLIEGEIETTVDGVTHLIVAGDLIVINPGESHSSQAITDSVVLSMMYSH